MKNDPTLIAVTAGTPAAADFSPDKRKEAGKQHIDMGIAFEQAKQFSAVTNITSLAITKLDGTAKGGVVIGISDQLKVPVKYIGLGEGMEDLQLFNKREFVDSLFKK